MYILSVSVRVDFTLSFAVIDNIENERNKTTVIGYQYHMLGSSLMVKTLGYSHKTVCLSAE